MGVNLRRMGLVGRSDASVDVVVNEKSSPAINPVKSIKNITTNKNKLSDPIKILFYASIRITNTSGGASAVFAHDNKENCASR